MVPGDPVAPPAAPIGMLCDASVTGVLADGTPAAPPAQLGGTDMPPIEDPAPAEASTGAAPIPPPPADCRCRADVAGEGGAQATDVGRGGRGTGQRGEQTTAGHTDHVRRG